MKEQFEIKMVLGDINKLHDIFDIVADDILNNLLPKVPFLSKHNIEVRVTLRPAEKHD